MVRFIYIPYHQSDTKTYIYDPCWSKKEAINFIKYKVERQGRNISDAKEIIRKRFTEEEEEERNDIVYKLKFDKTDKFIVVQKSMDSW